MARLTGLEPATPGVTGRYSNQLSYNRTLTLPRPIARRGERGLRRPRAPVKSDTQKTSTLCRARWQRPKRSGRDQMKDRCQVMAAEIVTFRMGIYIRRRL